MSKRRLMQVCVILVACVGITVNTVADASALVLDNKSQAVTAYMMANNIQDHDVRKQSADTYITKHNSCVYSIKYNNMVTQLKIVGGGKVKITYSDNHPNRVGKIYRPGAIKKFYNRHVESVDDLIINSRDGCSALL